MAIFEGIKSSNDIRINDTMSDEVVASNVPPRYLLLLTFSGSHQVHEEFAWFPLKEAMMLTPVFAYMASTREFHDFLGPDVIALAAPVRGSTPATMATQKIPVIASTAPSSSSLRTDNRGSRWDR